MDLILAAQAKALLDRINEKTPIAEVLRIVESCKTTLSKQSEPVKLWRSKIAWNWVIGSVFVALCLTVWKFWSNCNVIEYTHIDPTKPGGKVTYDLLNFILYGLWIIIPPLFFLYEYTALFGKEEKNRLDTLQVADLKYCHDLAGKIWAGVGVCLGLVLLVKYGIKP